ncbi:hypothetical protein SAMN05444920_11341 [Nonomuraea solani]|uniref:Uncharacterized protein n=1 Tax=Nonomuraea solani TaxID=1144553 RepID=A0A1H6ENM8_9ACTN|nr:hypothetical protein [Nonomuraea solani]SEG99437.1 hypothetical protein SAMN05444920_11341 [Nonomuraea solani]
MAEYQGTIRTQIDDTEFDGATLELLRQTLEKNKPQLIGQAAAEFLEAKARLDNLVGVIDKHLRELDSHWTAGDDAKTVKDQLRKLRKAASDISTTISDQPVDASNPPKNPHGVAPALIFHAKTLSAARGDVPDDPGSDISYGESALQFGIAGAAIGSFFGGVGAVPGAAIGAAVGLVAGGITRIFSDVPFLNLIGDSKEEQDRKKAAEAIKLLSQDTKLNNEVYPVELRTDIPQFTALSPNLPTTPFNGGKGVNANLPDGLNQPFDPTKGVGLDGLNQDGLRDPNEHQIPGMNIDDPTSNLPGDLDGIGDGIGDGDVGAGIGTGPDGTGGNGVNGPNGQNLNIPGLNDPNGVNGGPNGLKTPDGLNTPTTSLAGLPDPSTLSHPSSNPSTGLPNGTGIGNPYGGSGAGNGGFGTGGPGAGVNAAGLRGGMGNGAGMLPMTSLAGAGRGAGGGDRDEKERTTYLLEDEDYFMSDVSTTIHLINGERKGKA